MKTLKRADLINGSLVFFLAVQSAVSLFSLAHRVFDTPLATSRGGLGIDIPWAFIGLALTVTAVGIPLVARHIVRTSGFETTVPHVVSAKLWFIGYGVLTTLLSVYYLNTFTTVFRP
jgi:hypothetical protein